MAGQRLTDKTALTEQLASGDILYAVDVSDTTGSASGTSKQIANKYVIQTDVLSLASADVNALNTTPQTLVSAPGSGYVVQPITVTMICTYVSSQNIANFNLYVGYTGSGTGNFYTYFRSFYKHETADRTYILQADSIPADGTYAGTIDNQPLQIWSNGAFSGNWTMKVLTTYQLVKL